MLDPKAPIQDMTEEEIDQRILELKQELEAEAALLSQFDPWAEDED
jgi:ribosomal protein L29